MTKKFIAALIFILGSGLVHAQTLYLLRHFEKLDNSPDSGLTKMGESRAQALAEMLNSEPITHIFTSDFERTRASVAPLANALGLVVRVYNPRDLPALVATLSTIEVAVVVGHSNTTPQLIRLLGGEAKDMNEKAFGDLFILVHASDKLTTLQLTVPTKN